MLSESYIRLRELMLGKAELIKEGPRRAREEGQGMVEYALILVLIAVVVIFVLTTLGGRITNVFKKVCNDLDKQAGSC